MIKNETSCEDKAKDATIPVTVHSAYVSGDHQGGAVLQLDEMNPFPVGRGGSVTC